MGRRQGQPGLLPRGPAPLRGPQGPRQWTQKVNLNSYRKKNIYISKNRDETEDLAWKDLGTLTRLSANFK